MKKDFDSWNEEKKKANSEAPRFYTVREVWWCRLGVNVGSEQDGSGVEFLELVQKPYRDDNFPKFVEKMVKMREVYTRTPTEDEPFFTGFWEIGARNVLRKEPVYLSVRVFGQALKPVVIIRPFGFQTCLVVPLTTSLRKHRLRFPVGKVQEKEAQAILSQIRVVDTRRLVEKVGFLDKAIFQELRKAVKSLF